MKRKLIYLVIIAILMGAMIPLNAQAIDHTLTWHPSLDDDMIAWRIYEQFLFDPADPPTIANRDLYKGSVLAFEFNDTIPTSYSEVYDASHPPQFLKLFVDFTEVSFYDVDDQTEPAFALQFLVIPYIFHNAASGMNENITQFLEYRASTHPNITAIDYFISGGNYVTVSIYNDYFPSFQITYNNDTGICANFYVEDDFGEMWGQLDIWESSIDDSGVSITNTLNWHSSLTVNTILSWEFTEFNMYNASDYMEIGNHNASLGDIFKLKFIDALPTNPPEFYGPEPDFWEVYFKNDLLNWTEDMNRGGLIIFQTMINPLSVTIYNGTIATLEDIHEIREEMDQSISDLIISYSGDYMYLSMTIEYTEWRDDFEDYVVLNVGVTINTVSGIAVTVDYVIDGFGEFQLSLNENQSSIDEYGEENTDFTEDTETPGTFTIPGFNWILSSLVFLILIPIIRKRRK